MKHLCLFLLCLLCLPGCMTFGTNQSRETQISEGKKEVTKSASETDLNTERTKPLVDGTGSSGSTFNVNVEGQLPVERVKGSQSKAASEDTIMDMTLSETWEQVSGWLYLIIAVAFLIGVYAWKQLEGTRAFKIAETSIGGGLKVFNSVLGKLDDRLMRMNPDDATHRELKVLRDELAKKQTSLMAKSKSL